MKKLHGNSKQKIAIFFFIILFAFPFNLFSQVLTQDSKGNNSILYDGSTIGFNIQESSIDFNYNVFNYKRLESSNSVFGINFRAKNTDGIANLFETGEFTPETKGNLLFGYTFSNNGEYYKLLIKQSEIINDIRKTRNEYFDSIKMFDTNISNFLLDSVKNEVHRKVLNEKISTVIINFPDISTSKLFDLYQFAYNSVDTNIIDFTFKYITKITLNYNEAVNQKKHNLKIINESINNCNKNKTLQKFTFYTNIGFTGSSFKYYSNKDSNNFNKNFEDKIFGGYIFGLGANYQYGGKYLFGINFGIQRINNFEFLSKRDYTLKTTNSNTYQVLNIEKKISAYSGNYILMNQYSINADIMIFDKIGKEVIIIWHPYARQNFTDNETIFPSTTTLGLGTYFFKDNGTFQGGLYIEFPDINNNTEKIKSEPNIKPFFNRLTFGLVGKIALNSIMQL